MEQIIDQLDQNTFSCSICLDLLKNPVTIPCGHSYCKSCIETHWDTKARNDPCSCPVCRETFSSRPVLVKNIMLVSLMEHLKTTAADHCYAGADDVPCDVCTGRKQKAAKSCLVCLVSYCHKHLQPHRDVPRLTKHKLVDPSENLQENACPRHNEVMEIFCRTDGQCICYLCSRDEHKGHDMVSCEAERAERQKNLDAGRQKIQQRIHDKQKAVKLLQKEAGDICQSADIAEWNNREILTELIRFLKEKKRDVERRIRSREEMVLTRVKELRWKLQQEITELRRHDSEMEELCFTRDHNRFLLQYPTVSRVKEDPDLYHIQIHPQNYFEDVSTAVSSLRDKLLAILTEEPTNISPSVTQTQVPVEPEPTTRDGFL